MANTATSGGNSGRTPTSPTLRPQRTAAIPATAPSSDDADRADQRATAEHECIVVAGFAPRQQASMTKVVGIPRIERMKGQLL